MEKQTTIHVAVDRKLKQQLEELARKNYSLTLSSYVRTLLADHVVAKSKEKAA